MEKGEVMTRKDSEKDAERPHYYSQFWLDIAAGRRVIGGPKPEDTEASEVEAPEPVTLRKAGRGAAADGYKETHTSAIIEPAVEEEEEIEPEDTVEEADLPDIGFDEDAELMEEFAEEDYSEEEPTLEDEELFEEEEEEEEDEEEWGRRGARKKVKPSRPSKAPKKTKREPRRNF